MTNETETEKGFKIVRFKVIPTEEGYYCPIIEKTHKCLSNMQEHKISECLSLKGFKEVLK